MGGTKVQLFVTINGGLATGLAAVVSTTGTVVFVKLPEDSRRSVQPAKSVHLGEAHAARTFALALSSHSHVMILGFDYVIFPSLIPCLPLLVFHMPRS